MLYEDVSLLFEPKLFQTTTKLPSASLATAGALWALVV